MRDRERSQPPPSAAAASLQKTAAAAGATATPRRREKKEKDMAKEADIVKRLQQICTDADPTKLYRNLVKIGAGYVSIQLWPFQTDEWIHVDVYANARTVV